MIQPECFDGIPVLEPDVLPTRQLPEPAAWAWLAILVFVIGFEAWAIATGHHTLSQWLWRHPWAKRLGLTGLVIFIVHILL